MQTNKEYFEAIGVSVPEWNSKRPVTPEEYEAMRMKNVKGVPLTRFDAREMDRLIRKMNQFTELEEPSRERTKFFTECLYPMSDSERQWWYGVQIRWNPKSRLITNPATNATIENTTAVVCMVQLLWWDWLQDGCFKKENNQRAGYAVCAWHVQGAKFAIGSGSLKRLQDAQRELEYIKESGGNISRDELAYLQMNEDDRVEMAAKYLNEVMSKEATERFLEPRMDSRDDQGQGCADRRRGSVRPRGASTECAT
jgi:hypothetical protein